MKRTTNLNLTHQDRNAEPVPGMIHRTFGVAARVFLVLALALSMLADNNNDQSDPDDNKDDPGKHSSDLSQDKNALVDVIVQFKTPPTKQELKEVGVYGQMKKQLDGIKAINVQLTRKESQQADERSQRALRDAESSHDGLIGYRGLDRIRNICLAVCLGRNRHWGSRDR